MHHRRIIFRLIEHVNFIIITDMQQEMEIDMCKEIGCKCTGKSNKIFFRMTSMPLWLVQQIIRLTIVLNNIF